MPIGPGKYDELCTEVRQHAGALAAIVIVIEGVKGTGFSVQAPPELAAVLPELLREVAAELAAAGRMRADRDRPPLTTKTTKTP